MAYKKEAAIPPHHCCRCLLTLPPPNSYTVLFHNDIIHVTVAKRALHVHQWIAYIEQLHFFSVQKLVGLDTEWLPNMAPGEDHPIAIIQLCVGNHCLIFQILHSDGIPDSLHAFLADHRHVFCGIGIEGDIKKLVDHHGLYVRCYADLNYMRKMTTGEDDKEYRYLGLKKMATAVLGKEMKKPLQVTLSQWDRADLDVDQVEYAAVDAFVSFLLAFTLSSSIVDTVYLAYFC